MKRILSGLMTLAGLALFTVGSNAQEHAGCFMLGAGGQMINLNELCGDETGVIESSPLPNTSTSGVFTLPIKRREGGTPIVDVVFNGNQSFEMLFDTGATGTVITPDMAKALNVTAEAATMVKTAGGTVPNPVGRVASAQAGKLNVQDLVVIINSHITYGLLGQNFYGQYDVAILQDSIELRVRR